MQHAPVCDSTCSLPRSRPIFSLVSYVLIPVYSSKLNTAVTSKEPTCLLPPGRVLLFSWMSLHTGYWAPWKQELHFRSSSSSAWYRLAAVTTYSVNAYSLKVKQRWEQIWRGITRAISGHWCHRSYLTALGHTIPRRLHTVFQRTSGDSPHDRFFFFIMVLFPWGPCPKRSVEEGFWKLRLPWIHGESQKGRMGLKKHRYSFLVVKDEIILSFKL